MKSLLIFLLLAGGALLFFKERNDQEQIATLQAQNDELSRQLADKQQAFGRMQAQLQAQAQAVAATSPLAPPSPPSPASAPASNVGGFGHTALDQRPSQIQMGPPGSNGPRH